MNLAASNSYMADDRSPKRLEDVSSFFYLLRFTRQSRWRFIAGFLCLLISTVLTMLGAYWLGLLVQRGLVEHSRQAALNFMFLTIASELGALCIVYLGRRLLAKASSHTILTIRQALFNKLNELPLSYFDRQPQGRTVTRITHDVEGLEDFFASSMARMASCTLMATAAALAMLFTDLKVAAYTISAMLPSLVFTVVTRIQARELNREMARKSSAINSRLAEYINGISVIRGFALEDWSKKSFDQVVSTYQNKSIETNRFYAWVRPVTELLCNLPLLALIWFGGRGVLAGVFPIGLIVAFVRYCDRFAGPITELSREIHLIQQAFTSAERVSFILQSPDENKELGLDGTISPSNFLGMVEFKNVCMGYQSGKIVLDKISFEAQPGQKIGLCGETGSGKTSTVSLLSRLYDFQSGEILIDGQDIRSLRRQVLRSKIGFVSQDVVIFRGSLRENLDDSGLLADDEILDACYQTGLSRAMSERNLALGTLILDKGANLSVGERQLIALTRVLIKKPAILVLDEATGNIDPKTEELVHSAVDAVMADKTCLVIAHRLDTLKSCDQLLVFKDGMITESGKHEELIKRRGYYSELVASGGYSEPTTLYAETP